MSFEGTRFIASVHAEEAEPICEQLKLTFEFDRPQFDLRNSNEHEGEIEIFAAWPINGILRNEMKLFVAGWLAALAWSNGELVTK